MPFHIDYRPDSLENMIGNEAIVESLSNFLDDDTRPHAYAFFGPSGCGKTTLARIMAEALDGRGKDILEVNAAETRGIDTIRDISRRMYYKPVEGSVRVCILDEIHMATREAANALLKVVEDCPSHSYFFLCSTEPERIPTTLKNRCSTFVVTKLAKKNMKELISIVMEEEGIELSDDDVAKVIKRANGVPRTALMILDQIKSIKGEIDLDKLIVEDCEDITVPDLCKILMDEPKASKAWDKLRNNLKIALKNNSPERIRSGIVAYLGACLQSAGLTKAILIASIIRCFQQPAYEEGILWMQMCDAVGEDE